MLSIQFVGFGSKGALELMQYRWMGTPPTLQNLIYGMLKSCFIDCGHGEENTNIQEQDESIWARTQLS
jgi:hypothetical protein